MRESLAGTLNRRIIGNGSHWVSADFNVHADLVETGPETAPQVLYKAKQTRRSIDGKVYQVTYHLGELEMNQIQSVRDYGHLIRNIHMFYRAEFSKIYTPPIRPKAIPGEWYEAGRKMSFDEVGYLAEECNMKALDDLVKETEKTALAHAEAITSILESSHGQDS